MSFSNGKKTEAIGGIFDYKSKIYEEKD